MYDDTWCGAAGAKQVSNPLKGTTNEFALFSATSNAYIHFHPRLLFFRPIYDTSYIVKRKCLIYNTQDPKKITP